MRVFDSLVLSPDQNGTPPVRASRLDPVKAIRYE
jgi:hypothetical protein